MSSRICHEFSAELSVDGDYVCVGQPCEFLIEESTSKVEEESQNVSTQSDIQPGATVTDLFYATYYSNLQYQNNDLMRQAQESILAVQERINASLYKF